MLRPVNGLGWCYGKTNKISHDLVFTKRFPDVLSRFIARVRCPGDAGSPRSSGVPPRRSERRPSEDLFRRNLASRRRGRGIIVAVAFDSRRFWSQIEALESERNRKPIFRVVRYFGPFFYSFDGVPAVYRAFYRVRGPPFFTSSPLSRYFLLGTRACEISADASACGAPKCAVDGQQRSVRATPVGIYFNLEPRKSRGEGGNP